MIAPNQLPTDSLYKFAALSGLALFVFGLVYPLQRVEELEMRLPQVRYEIEVAQHQTEMVQLRLNLLDASLPQLSKIEEVAATGDTEVAAQLLESLSESMGADSLAGLHRARVEQVEEILPLLDRAVESRLRAEKLNSEVAVLLQQIREWFWLMVVLSGFGLLISVMGFWNWYKRIQRPSDLLLQSHLEKQESRGPGVGSSNSESEAEEGA